MPAGADTLPRILELVAAFHARGLPIVFVQHLHRADGSDAGRMGDFGSPDDPSSFVEGTARVELLDQLGVGADDIVVRKRRYSSFHGTDLESILRTLDVRSVVITGLMTSFCCETTARDAHGHDYEVLFVADANAGPDLQRIDGTPLPHDVVLENTMAAARGRLRRDRHRRRARRSTPVTARGFEQPSAPLRHGRQARSSGRELPPSTTIS